MCREKQRRVREGLGTFLVSGIGMGGKLGLVLQIFGRAEQRGKRKSKNPKDSANDGLRAH